MKLLLRWMFAMSCAAMLEFPAVAQNTGGLPSTEHMLALEALRQAERVVVYGDVVHYSFDVAVGPGEFDKIRIHRVVREAEPYRPVKKMEGVFLLPGLGNLFEVIFMPPASASAPAEKGSVAVFLANNDIDVWGMDYGWSFVPYGISDFSPLKGWGIGKDAQHAEVALSIARWMRATSGQGVGPINLLGFSYGGQLVYAVAGEDTQKPGNLKNVKGVIAVDPGLFKVPPGSSQQINACKRLPGIQANIDAGIYQVSDNNTFRLLGLAALSDPDGPVPVAIQLFPKCQALSNSQALSCMLVLGGYLAGSISPPPVTLVYTDPSRLAPLAAITPPYYPYQYKYDSDALSCDSDSYPVTFDDHLGDITVPIFYVSRIEGLFYSVTLTRSAEVSKLILNPSPTPYGHADLFWADNAADVVWQPILDWLFAHR